MTITSHHVQENKDITLDTYTLLNIDIIDCCLPLFFSFFLRPFLDLGESETSFFTGFHIKTSDNNLKNCHRT